MMRTAHRYWTRRSRPRPRPRPHPRLQPCPVYYTSCFAAMHPLLSTLSTVLCWNCHGNAVEKQCATEGQVCKCTGVVRYGSGERWSHYQPSHTSVLCNLHVFGDPNVGVRKMCMCRKASGTNVPADCQNNNDISDNNNHSDRRFPVIAEISILLGGYKYLGLCATPSVCHNNAVFLFSSEYEYFLDTQQEY